MRKTVVLLLILSLLLPAVLAEGDDLNYRFVDAREAAELLLGNREYYESMNQSDLDFRMQEHGATLEALEAFAAEQTLDFTDAEKERIGQSMALFQQLCAQRGYHLPPLDDIVFAKTTMKEESGASAYTHGTQIYLGESILRYGFSDNPEAQAFFDFIVGHELFHCLTRNHPDFRAAMYAILGFTVVEEDFVFSPEITAKIVANPDVEHHNSYAVFEINGEPVNCAVLFITLKPFEKVGDSFFDNMATGLVPIDDPSTLYTSDDAANFWDVFGRNTDYVVDPEEALADSFAYALIYGLDGREYNNPEIIEAIDSLLKAGFGTEAAA